MNYLPIIAIVAFGFFLQLSCSNPQGSTENIDDGQAIYTQNCVICHGKDGRLGAANAKDLSVSVLSEKETLNAIKKGSLQMGMPAYEKRLSETELAVLTTYVINLRH